MSKFLNTSATNYYLEELIKSASERLVLISPYLRLNDRVKELLEDKNRLKIDVRIVYGKNELHPNEISWLKDLSYIRTSFCKNLHAKCYLNEDSAIISSLNLYEFSQVNNNEMGVLFVRQDDPDLYKDCYEEAQRIIRISDEIRMSLEKILPEVDNPKDESTDNGSANDQSIDDLSKPYEKLTSSKFAKSLNLKTQDLLDKAVDLGIFELKDGKHWITDEAKQLGIEFRSSQHGGYFLWPKGLELI